jgi:uncharacterized membrane protein
MNVLLKVLEYISLGIGIIALAVIIWGVIKGLVEVVRAEVSRIREKGERFLSLGQARYDVGYHLLVGLEFLIAADIIRTIIKPTLEELAILGSIVAIRIVIGYFLGKEIENFSNKR